MKTFAFLFPGQGSQTVGMLDAWGDHPAVQQTLQEASTALGIDVAHLIHEGPAAELDLTVNTQPMMLAASIEGLGEHADGGCNEATPYPFIHTVWSWLESRA